MTKEELGNYVIEFCKRKLKQGAPGSLKSRYEATMDFTPEELDELYRYAKDFLNQMDDEYGYRDYQSKTKK